MRWVEGDTVKLHPDYHVASEEARIALQERFPNAWQWYTGFNTPGMLHGEQIGAIIEGRENEEVEEWQADYEQLRSMVQFLLSNWIDAGRVHRFGYGDWDTIFHALRYCAEKIGYLPNSKRLDELRDNSRALSGRLVGEGYISTDEGLKDDGPHFYEGDWIVILRACQFAYKHLNPDNQAMAEVKAKLADMTPRLLERIKYHEHIQLSRNGLKEVTIHRRLNEIEIEPWNFQEDTEKNRERYWELRKLQGDDTQDPGDWLHVLRFCINDYAKVRVFDRLGKFKEEYVVDPGEYVSYRQHDLEFAFNSEVFTFGGGLADRLVVACSDVTIKESNIHCSVKQLEPFMDYIYANYKVEKYKRKE